MTCSGITWECFVEIKLFDLQPRLRWSCHFFAIANVKKWHQTFFKPDINDMLPFMMIIEYNNDFNWRLFCSKKTLKINYFNNEFSCWIWDLYYGIWDIIISMNTAHTVFYKPQNLRIASFYQKFICFCKICISCISIIKQI